MRNALVGFLLTSVAVGMLVVTAMWPGADAAASIPMGVAAELGQQLPAAAPTHVLSTTVTCIPMALWNPDAGVGLVRCGAGYQNITVETESATAVKFVYRYKNEDGGVLFPVTRADLDTFGLVRKTSGNNTAQYKANVAGQSQLFCVTQLDAGIVLGAECNR